MRLKKLICGAAVLGLGAGVTVVGAASSADAASTTISPYIFNVANVGQTHAGFADNLACSIAADGAFPGNNGRINGVIVGGHAGELNVTMDTIATEDDPSEETSTCVPIAINVTATAAYTDAVAPKTGGVIALSLQSDLQGGVQADSVQQVDVILSAGQTLKLPGGALLASGSLTGPGTARILLKAVTVKTKAVYTTSCADEIKLIDTTVHDAKGYPDASRWDGVTAPDAPAEYLATLRECALVATNTPGKLATTKITIVGDGHSEVRYVEAGTVDPQTWDSSMGSCSVVKVASAQFGSTAADAGRIIACKGDYGAAIEFTLNVRGKTTNGGQDPYGLQHPAPPLDIDAGHTF